MKLIESKGFAERFSQQMGEIAKRIEVIAEQAPISPADMEMDVSFPFRWTGDDGNGGPRPEDPLSLNIWLETHDGTESYTWRHSIGEMVDDLFEGLYDRDGCITRQEFDAVIKPMADALRDLADDMMSADIAEPPPTTDINPPLPGE